MAASSEDAWFPNALDFRLIEEKDLAAVQALEAESYPEDEAASASMLKFRSEVARDFFYVAPDAQGDIVAYVCGTTTDKDRLGEWSMAFRRPAHGYKVVLDSQPGLALHRGGVHVTARGWGAGAVHPLCRHCAKSPQDGCSQLGCEAVHSQRVQLTP